MAELPAPPAAAAQVFGDRLELATRYAAWLAGAGTVRGLIGPHEVPRLWERHLVNSALVSDAFPTGQRIVDVGSGAGLPGLVLAIRRPDLRIELVEPLLRRATFLQEVVEALGLAEQVTVVRGRAEEPAVRRAVGGAAWVTARAVAPLDRLAGWCLPLLRDGGTLVALKGERAEAEVAEQRDTVMRLGGSVPVVVTFEMAGWPEPTTVVLVTRTGGPAHGRTKRRS